MELKVLSAGAAQGVVRTLAEALCAETGAAIDGAFGAVGAMQETLVSGAPCDLIILSAKLIAELAASGDVIASTCADLGVVRTGIAVRAADPDAAIGDAQALRASLLAAEGIYFPDPQRATAGIHFASLLQRLGIADAVAARVRTYPNGATAMRELAGTVGARLIGCTQVTEINATLGVRLVGVLPREFELATTYSLGVCTRAAAPDLARRFAAMLTGPGSRALRQSAGFEL